MEPAPQPQPDTMADVVHRNIHALLERRRAEDRQKSRSERLAERVTAFAGSMRFVYLHVGVFGSWIILNLPWMPTWLRFDPTYVVLAMTASVEAIFLSTFVLITQNRMSVQADRRADLDLQISLLSEHEITRLIRLVAAMADRMGVAESGNAELRELQQDVRPEAVLDTMREKQNEFGAKDEAA